MMTEIEEFEQRVRRALRADAERVSAQPAVLERARSRSARSRRAKGAGGVLAVVVAAAATVPNLSAPSPSAVIEPVAPPAEDPAGPDRSSVPRPQVLEGAPPGLVVAAGSWLLDAENVPLDGWAADDTVKDVASVGTQLVVLGEQGVVQLGRGGSAIQVGAANGDRVVAIGPRPAWVEGDVLHLADLETSEIFEVAGLPEGLRPVQVIDAPSGFDLVGTTSGGGLWRAEFSGEEQPTLEAVHRIGTGGDVRVLPRGEIAIVRPVSVDDPVSLDMPPAVVLEVGGRVATVGEGAQELEFVALIEDDLVVLSDAGDLWLVSVNAPGTDEGLVQMSATTLIATDVSHAALVGSTRVKASP